jgi:MFS family permease
LLRIRFTPHSPKLSHLLCITYLSAFKSEIKKVRYLIFVLPPGNTAQVHDDETERSKVMGTVLGGIAAGVLIGYPFGGVLYDLVGKTAPFVIIAILTLVVLAGQIAFIMPLDIISVKKNQIA